MIKLIEFSFFSRAATSFRPGVCKRSVRVQKGQKIRKKKKNLEAANNAQSTQVNGKVANTYRRRGGKMKDEEEEEEKSVQQQIFLYFVSPF